MLYVCTYVCAYVCMCLINIKTNLHIYIYIDIHIAQPSPPLARSLVSLPRQLSFALRRSGVLRRDREAATSISGVQDDSGLG